MAKKNKKTLTRRNVTVVVMMTRSQKAGSHGDKRKAQSKKACRGKVKP